MPQYKIIVVCNRKNKNPQEESSSVSGYIFEEDHQGAATHKHVLYAWLMTWQPFHSASIVQAKIISLYQNYITSCGATCYAKWTQA